MVSRKPSSTPRPGSPEYCSTEGELIQINLFLPGVDIVMTTC
jgi:hypothetical protein